MSLNLVPQARIVFDAGNPAFQKAFKRLAQHYYAPRLPGYWAPDPDASKAFWRKRIPDHAHFAQSIVVRSEIQPFNISSPRFAFRTRFEDPDNESVIHLRRLEALFRYISLLKLSFSDRTADATEQHPSIGAAFPGGSMAPKLRRVRSQALADCFLTPPKYINQTDFHIITAALHASIGEPIAPTNDAEEVLSTPFAATAHIAGGLCAQSCCFMATALMHDHASAVCGIADITYRAADPKWKELFISGLDYKELPRYFETVGLSAPLQYPRVAALQGPARELALKRMLLAIRYYTLSDFPTILFVDAAKLSLFYDDHGVEPISPEEAGAEPVGHALLCVGCERFSKSNEPRDQVFLVNDPSMLPFMRIKGHDILEAPSSSSEHKVVGLFPVLPKKVVLHLLQSDRSPVGLFELSGLYPGGDGPHFGFVLAQGKSLSLQGVSIAYPESPLKFKIAEFTNPANLSIWLKENLGWDDEHWFWIERRQNGILIWDAETTSSSVIGPSKNLVAKAMLENLRFRAVSFRMASPAAVGSIGVPRFTPTPKSLHASVITSCNVRQFGRQSVQWPAGIEHLEVYAFMNDDLVDLGFTRSRAHPLRVLADCEADSKKRDRRAKELAMRISEFYGQKEIIGFATYVPEMNCDADAERQSELAQTASNFMTFLARTAGYLNSRPDGQPFTIELVAGGVFDGIWPAKHKRVRTADGYGVNLISPEKIIGRVLRNLKQATDLAQKRESMGRIQFAIECEPGRLCALEKRENLLYLSNLLDSLLARDPNNSIGRLVGLNCDIPHWSFLSDITAADVVANSGEPIRNRIIHAHISDHTKGHWCDRPLYSKHKPEDFQVWIDIFRGLHWTRPASHPKFSKCVSIELEACRDRLSGWAAPSPTMGSRFSGMFSRSRSNLVLSDLNTSAEELEKLLNQKLV